MTVATEVPSERRKEADRAEVRRLIGLRDFQPGDRIVCLKNGSLYEGVLVEICEDGLACKLEDKGDELFPLMAAERVVTYNLGSRQHALLVEALRRFECFFARRIDNYQWSIADLQRTRTGLGRETEYRTAVNAGLMCVASCTSPPTKGCDGWWSLTRKGAEIVLWWHGQGYGVGEGFEVINRPPARKD